MATVGISKGDNFLSVEWILKQFLQKKIEAERRYSDFVRDGLRVGTKSPWEQLTGQMFLGSSQFAAKMQEQLGKKKDIGEISREQRYPGRPSLLEQFKEINSKQDRNQKITIAHLDYGFTLQQIAEVFGIHYKTVSRVIRRAS